MPTAHVMVMPRPPCRYRRPQRTPHRRANWLRAHAELAAELPPTEPTETPPAETPPAETAFAETALAELPHIEPSSGRTPAAARRAAARPAAARRAAAQHVGLKESATDADAARAHNRQKRAIRALGLEPIDTHYREWLRALREDYCHLREGGAEPAI